VRMSTEHQQYSTENQAAKIREYASQRQIEIIRTYADAGKSGLRIDGREALQRLLKDVENGDPGFRMILVYDVKPLGALPGRRRKRVLRVPLPSRRHPGRVLR